MSIYQSQYLFMKQHFYQPETEAMQLEEEFNPTERKKPARSRDRRKKRRR